jgi:hypothetical protein
MKAVHPHPLSGPAQDGGPAAIHPHKGALELSKNVQIYKACEDRAARLDALQHQSQDEDVVADAGKDLIEINMVKRFLKEKSDETWGASGGPLRRSFCSNAICSIE